MSAAVLLSNLIDLRPTFGDCEDVGSEWIVFIHSHK